MKIMLLTPGVPTAKPSQVKFSENVKTENYCRNEISDHQKTYKGRKKIGQNSSKYYENCVDVHNYQSEIIYV